MCGRVEGARFTCSRLVATGKAVMADHAGLCTGRMALFADVDRVAKKARSTQLWHVRKGLLCCRASQLYKSITRLSIVAAQPNLLFACSQHPTRDIRAQRCWQLIVHSTEVIDQAAKSGVVCK